MLPFQMLNWGSQAMSLCIRPSRCVQAALRDGLLLRSTTKEAPDAMWTAFRRASIIL